MITILKYKSIFIYDPDLDLFYLCYPYIYFCPLNVSVTDFSFPSPL
jgi:hypothetical protein